MDWMEQYSPVFHFAIICLQEKLGYLNVVTRRVLIDDDIQFIYLPSASQSRGIYSPHQKNLAPRGEQIALFSVVSEPHCFFTAENEYSYLSDGLLEIEDPKQPLTAYLALTQLQIIVFDYFKSRAANEPATKYYEVHTLEKGDILVIKGHLPHSIGKAADEESEVSYFRFHFIPSQGTYFSSSNSQGNAISAQGKRTYKWYGSRIPATEDITVKFGARADSSWLTAVK
jgi:hypothetical protein